MMWTYLAPPLLALISSFLLARVAARFGPRLGAMDRPKPLSIHSTPTPRTGGLAVLAGFVMGKSTLRGDWPP